MTLIPFTMIKNEQNLNHGLIIEFLTSNDHALRSIQRDSVISTEIFFVLNNAKIPNYYQKIKKFSIRLFDNHQIDFEA